MPCFGRIVRVSFTNALKSIGNNMDEFDRARTAAHVAAQTMSATELARIDSLLAPSTLSTIDSAIAVLRKEPTDGAFAGLGDALRAAVDELDNTPPPPAGHAHAPRDEAAVERLMSSLGQVGRS